MTNPYFDDDADADILKPHRERKGLHALDGSLCERCGKTHNIKMPPGVPSEVLDHLSDMLDRLPESALEINGEIIVTKDTPGKSELLGSFMEFAREVGTANQMGPMVRAVAEVLDEQTNGEVTRRWMVYKHERDLIVCHTVLKSVNSLLDGIRSMDQESGKYGVAGQAIIELLDELVKTSLDRLHETGVGYRKACEENGMPVDENLLSNGIAEVAYTPIAQHTMKDWFDAEVDRLIRGD